MKLSLESILEYIRKQGNNYVVKSHSGKNMGKYKSKKAATKRLRQIEYWKHHS